MENILFIYNPNSGKGRIAEYLDGIKEILTEGGRNIDIYKTKGAQDAMFKVQKDAAGYDLVVCAGGDGTLSEVVSGMMHLKNRVPIGFIPAGSTNDSRLGFGLPKDILEAAPVCVEGVPFETDVGRFNDEYFIYIASLGALSSVACFTPPDMKRLLGHGAYVIEGFKQLIRMESSEMTVEFDGQEIKGDFFLGFVSNSMTVGGFEGIMGGDVDLQDGLFEVTLFKRINNIMDFTMEVDKMLIHNKPDGPELDDVIVRFKTGKVKFLSDKPIQWVRDGENGGEHKVAEIEVCRKAVTIMSARKDH